MFKIEKITIRGGIPENEEFRAIVEKRCKELTEELNRTFPMFPERTGSPDRLERVRPAWLELPSEWKEAVEGSLRAHYPS